MVFLLALTVLCAVPLSPMAAAAQAPDRLLRARELNAEALEHLRQWQAHEGVPKAREALGIREAVLDPAHPDVAESLQTLADLLRDAGDYAGARPLYERALKIREQAFGSNHGWVAQTLNSLGALLYLTGDYSGARPLLERALKIRERVRGPNQAPLAITLTDLGVLLHAMGDSAGARPLLERALRIREQAFGPGHPLVATSLHNLADLLGDTGDYAAARPLHERALTIREQALGPDHPAVASSLQALGHLHQLRGDLPTARRLYERALTIREKALGPTHPVVTLTLSRLSFLLRAAGDHGAARNLAERVVKIREQTLGPTHPLVAWSLNSLGFQRRVAGDLAGARPLYERALSIARNSGVPEVRWRAAFGLAIIHEREARLAEALPLYREAVKSLEELAGQFGEEGTRAQYLQSENRLAVYDALARLLLRLHEQDSSQGHDREAWAVLEAKKGRVAAGALGAVRPQVRDAKAKQAVEGVQAKQDRLLALDQELREEQAKAAGEQQAEKLRNLTTLMAQTKAEYLAQVQGLLTQYPQHKALFVDQQTVDPKALAKFAGRLPPGTLVVQYFASPDALYLFLVAPGGLFQVKRQAVSQADLYGLIKQYRQHLERAATQRLPWAEDGSDAYRRDVLPLKALTRQLSAHLLGPLTAELGKHREVVLIPNDLLLYLPIHALTRELPDGSVRFLTESHMVSYLTQLELVDLLNPSRPVANAPLLALADPDGSLPAASREVRALRSVRPSVTALEGPQATKERFLSLASQFPQLHLATHGVLDPERPERSYLLMAGAEEASQRLGIGEIAGLSLQNGLAILSACETAVGEQVPGAALITLAAAFSQAGAESIVASLWQVNDAATRDLMVAFHRALATVGRAAALQQAQIAVLQSPQTAHPYYWAPFILIGAR